jgi:predicted acetyltransferase
VTEPVYKLIPPEDLELFISQERHAFSGEADIVRLEDEGQRAHHLPQLRGLYADERLVAQLQLYPLRVATGGGQLAVGGIGSVATPPEQRRRGFTAAMLRAALDELRAQNTPLCALFAYSRAFYHRLGWATAMERRVYRGAPKLLRGFTRSDAGGFEAAGPEAIAELDQIYQQGLRGRFGPFVRDTRHWATQVLANWQRPNHCYLWRDGRGTPRAYIAYAFEQDGSYRTRVLDVRDAVALDPEARAQLFTLIADHAPQCASFTLRTPADAPVAMLMPEPPACEVELHIMYRFVDLVAALEGFAFPAGCAGRLALAVRDPWYGPCQGVFELEVADGKASCRRLPDDSPFDLACEVQVLTQIYTRYLRPRSAAAFGLLEVRERAALRLLESCFAGPAPFCSDYF